MSGEMDNEEDDDRTGVEVIEGMDDSIPQIGGSFTAAVLAANEVAVGPSPLLQFSHSVRYRIGKGFAAGPYEGRLKLEFTEHVVSGTTYDDIVLQLTAKAVQILAKKAELTAKIAARQA